MKIKVRMIPANNPGNRVAATADITLNDEFVIHDVKVIRGREGNFVAMPSRLGNDGIFRDVVHPINHDAREMVNHAVLDEYYRMNTG